MPKRVFGPLSTNVNCNFGNIGKFAVKREAEKSPIKKSKKFKPQIKQDAKEDQENHCMKENAVKTKESENTTRTIELRVRNICIGSEKEKLIFEKQSQVRVIKKTEDVQVEEEEEESLEYKSLPNSPEIKKVVAVINFEDPLTYYVSPKNLPPHVDDFDKENIYDIFSEPQYANDVFKYYKEKEVIYLKKKCLEKQNEISKAMRAILVDWMVEVQESFELNHETLYLAVSIVDHYLYQELISKSRFQLLGATAILIAAKFDERIPPSLDDFLYICDDAYVRRDIVLMEIDVLKKLNFFIGFPLSYRFLRRFARCAKVSMEVLTLARYILETSLMDYDIITCKDSLVAAAALLLSLKMKGAYPDHWTSTLEFYSGYDELELTELMYKLNDLISVPCKPNLKTIRNKYSHKIFFEVAKIAPLSRRKSNK